MAMQKMKPAESPDAYVAALAGWRRILVDTLRNAVRGAAPLDERIKWGHLVYFSNGPVLLVRAEESRVLFGFWRGQRLRGIAPRLKPGGKYEMATWELREGDSVDAALATRLAAAATELNRSVGDPTAILQPKPAKNVAAKKVVAKKVVAKKVVAKKVVAKKVVAKKVAAKKAPAKPAKKAATPKAAARKPAVSPSGSARRTSR